MSKIKLSDKLKKANENIEFLISLLIDREAQLDLKTEDYYITIQSPQI